eukprot:TRINITY_DN2366_c1_g3_i1.p1 TRINITY_DN2366_c1_g3~~TRINITY_DN2366_c1_g3_i1.p1  ORF type:complete len:138 (+),score=31.48 TRINITY_DN2366_c1_g3_i1:78-491(+)
MFRATVTRLSTTRLDAHKLMKDINQEPMKNWRAAYAQKLSPNKEAGAKAVHKHRVHEEGPEYGQLTANNFPYPLMYFALYFLWAVVAVAGYYDVHYASDTNWPTMEYSRKNADGTTYVPAKPATPNGLFSNMVVIKE